MHDDSDPPRTGPSRRRGAKTFVALAADLRERILAGEFVSGMLPSEREIVDETGLGRGSVREALRVLEAEGLVRSQAGRNGGTFTTLPDAGGLTHFVSLFVRGRRVPLRSLIEARAAVESSLAFYAARNRTADDIRAFELACAQLEQIPDGPDFAHSNVSWHYAVATASHNELLVAFLSSIASTIERESLAHARVFEARGLTSIRASVIRIHRSISDAIIAGDCEAAKRRMERHLHAYADSVTAAESNPVALA